jgi:phosphatidylglycerophosphatase A
MDSESQQPTGKKKPRVAMLIATGLGLGYLPKAPGTWGSVGGAAIIAGIGAFFVGPFAWLLPHIGVWLESLRLLEKESGIFLEVLVAVIIGLFGTWASTRASQWLQKKDPQEIVIDEVSGMTVALILGLGAGFYPLHEIRNPDFVGFSYLFFARMLNWKYLVVGFILFRVFDIWKPWPVRAAEKLPGGWGIMADDWVAGVYAALALWGARALGL